MRALIPLLLLAFAATSCATSHDKGDAATSETDGAALVTDITATRQGEAVLVTIEADASIPYTVFKLKDPMRLIIDMSQLDLSGYTTLIPVNEGPVTALRPSYYAESSDGRIEIDLSSDADYVVDDSDPKRLVISLTATEETAVMTPPTPDVMTVSDVVNASPSARKMEGGLRQVENVTFEKVGRMDRIVVTLSEENAPYELVARDQMNRITIDLPGSVVSVGEEKVLNVNLAESRVKNIAFFQFRDEPKPLAKVVINLEEMALYEINSTGKRIVLDIGDEAVLAQASQMSGQAISDEQTLGLGDAAYTGSLISLDFQKADIHNILRIIADVSGHNIITSGRVKGTVTMKLHDVPWDQALDVILRNNGLDKVQEGNIIRVATVDEVKTENEARQTKRAAEQNLAPLYTRIFEINYESAARMKTNLESIKSAKGQIEINERTNTLIVQDTKGKLAEMAGLIKKLDKKEKQVLIEARLVEITHSRARELGVQWGGYYTGITGQNFPGIIGVTGAGGATPNGGFGNNSVVNLGVPNPAGAIGISLGHIGGTAQLDARLMAIERAGEGRIVSMPRITTMNNKQAIIEAGTEVPFQTTSSDGTKTEFKKAVLKLQVTPHVTPDDNVRLQISATKDTADFANTTPAGPPIRTKKAQTEVLVANGETTVIGGLFQNTDQTTNRQVPVLGDLPFLGWLFKNKGTTRDSEELLIFITPKIVE